MTGMMTLMRVPRPSRVVLIGACDAAERLIVLALYAALVLRLARPEGERGPLTNLLLIASEGIAVMLLLARRPTRQISTRWHEWLLAFSATAAPLLVRQGAGTTLAPVSLAAALLVAGMVIQIHAKLALGRSFGCVPANRGLKIAGPYRFVRHPMYAGYLLSHVAFLLANPTLWNAGVYLVTYALQVPRIFAEERFLADDPRYRQYERAVRYRLIPGVF